MKESIINNKGAGEAELIRHWDEMAESFDFDTVPGPEDEPILAFLKERGLPQRNMRVLDIGCAAGRYSLYFASCCRETVGLDISPEMIRRAGKNAEHFGAEGLRFIRSSWEALDTADIGGEKSFDFIFSNLSPALKSEEDIDKLLSLARGYCLYGATAKSSRLIGDKIHRLLELPLSVRGNQEGLPEIFSLLWKRGIRPELHYIPVIHRSGGSIEDFFLRSKRLYSSLLERYKGEKMSAEQEKKLRELIEGEARDGRIYEEHRSLSALLIWNMQDI